MGHWARMRWTASSASRRENSRLKNQEYQEYQEYQAYQRLVGELFSRQRHRNLGLDPGADAADRPADGRVLQLWRGFHRHQDRQPFGSGLIAHPSGTFSLNIIASALVGATTWNLLTWWKGLLFSSSHALFGALPQNDRLCHM
ncbi:MAG: hypothetical protein H7270_16425 [Dermatophilaceae bacterium]|nr:hypothetical protein [Dermatophilaceae bacterium]